MSLTTEDDAVKQQPMIHGAQITPGPWHVNEFNQIVDETGYLVHTCAGGSADADARLIATAPALLAALEALIEQQDAAPDAYDTTRWETARSAIATARGES